jgi:hypothetical protein
MFYLTPQELAESGAGSQIDFTAAVSKPTITTVNYIARTADKPKTFIDPDGSRGIRDETVYESHTVTIHDARPFAEGFFVEDNGFALVTEPTNVVDFSEEAEIEQIYYPEVEALIKAQTGAEKVVIFDHTVRVDGDEEGGVRTPVRKVHGDYTPKSGPQRVHDLLPADEAKEWLGRRYAIINVWRPINRAVERAPLGFIDGETSSEEDFVAIDLIYPHRVGEIFGVAHNPDHRWYTFSAMRPDEAVLIKTFDSDPEAAVRFTAHGAFDDPATTEDAAPRESIEVRTLVLLPRA